MTTKSTTLVVMAAILFLFSGCSSARNKQTVTAYMDGFRTNDHPKILSCLTDDVEWLIPGAFHTRGKADFATHITDDGFIPPPEITITRLIEQSGTVVAEGTVQTRRTDGTILRLAFCDIFEMHHHKIRKLTSYLMETK